MVESLRIRVEHYLYRERLRLLGWAESPYREQLLAENKRKILELRSNENHDPANGRFTSGPGGSSGKGLTEGKESGKLKSSEKPEWSGKEAREPFNYWELAEDKSAFPVNPKPKSFSGSGTLKDHFERHGKGVGAETEADYVKKAIEFLASPRGKHGDAFVNKNGRYGRYDYDTKIMAIAFPNGVIGTFWNLRDDKTDAEADAYWRKQK